MITNKKIIDKLDSIEKNLKKELNSLRVDNETRFNELDKRSELLDKNRKLEIKLKDCDSIIEKYATKTNELEATSKKQKTEIEKLKKENETLKSRNEELESSSYLRVELEPEKPKTQKMSMKASKVKSCKTIVNKKLKEISENNLEKEPQNV